MTTPDEPTTPEPDPGRSGGWRRFVPRRRGAVIGASVLGVLVIGAIVAALVLPGPGGRGFDRERHGFGGPGGPGDHGPAAVFGDELGFGTELDGGPDAQGPRGDRGPEGRRGPGGPLARLGDDTLLTGTVVSTGAGTLVVTPDGPVGGIAQRTLRTDEDTRVFGRDNRAVGDLAAGERVLLRVDGAGDTATVVGVFAPRARVAGTVTALTGDQATIVAVNGLTVTADLAGIGQKPVVGDLVVITGGASGSTLRADELRVLPKTP